MGKRRTVILICAIILSITGSIGQTLPDACPGSRVRYSVQGLPNSVFSWNVQGGSIVISYNDSVDIQWSSIPGSYKLSVTEITQNSCTGPQILASVTIGGDTADLGGNQAVCLGDLADFSTTKPFAKYLWYDNSTQNFLRTGTPGVVWVEVTSASGCISRDSVNLIVNQPLTFDLGPDRQVCDTNLTLDGPLLASLYNWTILGSDGNSQPEHTQSVIISKAVGTQTVSLQIVDMNGCTNTYTVKILECGNILGIMNTITPNGDQFNQVWKIKNIELYPNAVIKLYDRWGRLVYARNGGYQNDFEGKGPNDNPLPMDSYFYVIDLKDGSKPITGYLLIIR
jgi:gliding motility-associated-like protein